MWARPPFSGKSLCYNIHPKSGLLSFTFKLLVYFPITIRLSDSFGELGHKVDFSQPLIEVPKLFVDPLILENNKKKMLNI